jgi:hypothetical protein
MIALIRNLSNLIWQCQALDAPSPLNHGQGRRRAGFSGYGTTLTLALIRLRHPFGSLFVSILPVFKNHCFAFNGVSGRTRTDIFMLRIIDSLDDIIPFYTTPTTSLFRPQRFLPR